MKKVQVFLALIFLVGIGVGFYVLFLKPEKKEVGKVEKVKVVEKTDGYNYKLYENSTKLYKEIFKELKNVLKEDTIDEEKYAEYVSKLFVADFYSLNTKVTNKDIGGTDFIYKKSKTSFMNIATDTLYKNIKSNVYGDREQELPEVVSFTSASVTKSPFSYKSVEEGNKFTIDDPNGYKVKLNFTYDIKTNNPKSCTIQLVHEDKYLYIVSVE